MSEQNSLTFPYEFKELEPEEISELLRVYKATEVDSRFDFLSVGPKKYKQLRTYAEHAAELYNLSLRSTDIFVNTFPRSGTTWTQELVWLVANDLDYATARNIQLRDRYIFTESFTLVTKSWQEQFLQNAKDKEAAAKALEKMTEHVTETLSSTPSPRFMKSHLPLSLLPPYLLDTAKLVYVARDPRDVAVSCYYYTRLYKVRNYTGSFKDYWDVFRQGLVYAHPYFEHVKEAWAKRQNPNMLFLFYEELLKDLPGSVRRVAKFLNKELTDEEVAHLCDHLSFENFKKNESVNRENWKKSGLYTEEGSFIRKGKAGGWREYFDEEMTQQAEQWIKENLQNTDLRFPHM